MTDTTESDDTADEQTPGARDAGESARAASPAEPVGNGGAATEGAPAETGTPQGGAVGEPTADESSGSPTAGERLAWLVQVGALVILCLVALVAVFRFYFAASTAIRVWIADDFVSVFQAAFNLLVLVACAMGVSVLVRRLS